MNGSTPCSPRSWGRARWSGRRSSFTTSPGWCAARPRAKGSATSSSPDPRDRCDLSRRPGAHRRGAPRGTPGSGADIEAVEAELMLADLGQAEGRLARVVKQAASGDPEAGRRTRVARARDRGARPRRGGQERAGPGHGRRRAGAPPGADLKPVLYVANVDEGVVDSRGRLRGRGGAAPSAVAIAARIESGSRRWTVEADKIAELACRPRGSSA